ncbi:MAG: hypothetical protein KGM17_12185 [Sphingomonadales bacterium]|nr:hypothetical protein [Sphingomonadales bacterium]
MVLAAQSPSSVLNARPMIGWQTLLADLSLILFMVTAAAVDASPDEPRPAAPRAPIARPAEAPRSEPIAVWRANGAAPPLGRWLREQSPDPRQQLTIAVHYAGGAAALPAALARAATLGREAQAHDVAARVLVEPGADDVVATLAYDRLRQTGTRIAGKGG